MYPRISFLGRALLRARRRRWRAGRENGRDDSPSLAPRTNQVVQRKSSVPRLVQFSQIFVMGCDRDRLPSFLAHVGEVGARAARERDGGERRAGGRTRTGPPDRARRWMCAASDRRRLI